MRCGWVTSVVVVLVLGGAPVLVARRNRDRCGPAVRRHAAGIAAALGMLVVFGYLSLLCGALEVDLATAWAAIGDYDRADPTQVVVRELRVPRTIAGAVAGACFAVAGALTQGVTRNPLGDPGILGINAGAAFAVVLAVFVAQISAPAAYVWFAYIGALGAAVGVYAIASGGRGGPTPVGLALSGAVIAALLGSLTAAILMLDADGFDRVGFWLAGSLAGRGTEELALVAPVAAVGLVMSLAMGRHINALSLGAEVAGGLGVRVGAVRALAWAAVVGLVGSAVAVAGPVAFVGLAIPHMVRSLVGSDYRWILVYSAILGPSLVLGADVVGRVVAAPNELQVGIVAAALGAPFLVHLVRSSRLAEL